LVKTSSAGGARSVPSSPNKLLASLPSADYRRLFPSLTSVPLPFKKVLHKLGAKIDVVYFPGWGACSITNVMKDGRMVEVAAVGPEGMVGITIFLGGDYSPGETFVQVAGGDGQSMTSEAFRRELARRGPFYDVISRYSQALQVQMMQSIACNSLHTVEERCARWLLMTHDRVEGDRFVLTHEFLGFMLGVRRPTVSLVLGLLDKAGLIEIGTKKITVVNRKLLEKASCECYQVVKSTFDRLLPQQARTN
jgi:CRP-like cAMP-binding protein